MSVCLSAARISQNPNVQIAPNFLYTLPVAMARSPINGNVICYALPVLWITSSFHIMERMDQNQRRLVCFAQFAMCRHRGRSLPSQTASCYWLSTMYCLQLAYVITIIISSSSHHQHHQHHQQEQWVQWRKRRCQQSMQAWSCLKADQVGVISYDLVPFNQL